MYRYRRLISFEVQNSDDPFKLRAVLSCPSIALSFVKIAWAHSGVFSIILPSRQVEYNCVRPFASCASRTGIGPILPFSEANTTLFGGSRSFREQLLNPRLQIRFLSLIERYIFIWFVADLSVIIHVLAELPWLVLNKKTVASRGFAIANIYSA